MNYQEVKYTFVCVCVCVCVRGGSIFLEVNYPSTKSILLLLFSHSNESDSL